MKKGKSIRAFLIAVIALALVFVAAICVFGADGAVIRGDVNGDGKVNSYDADYLLMHASFPNNPKYAINQSGDMNGDGKVNSYDADRLLMHASFPNNPKYALADSFSEGLEYELNDDGKGYTVSGKGTCKDTNLIIPSTYNNLPVTSIGDSAFFGCTNLVNIRLPDSITSIGNYAFSDTAYYKDAANWASDGLYIGNYLIQASPDVASTKYIIKAEIKCIADGAFDGCKNLESISVESGNTAYYSKDNCVIKTATKTLVVGCKNSIVPTDGSVTSIGNNAFYRREGLVSITIPNSVVSIGDYALFACKDLKSITIGSGVAAIGNQALSACSSLESIMVDGENTVYHSSGNCLIYTDIKALILGCKNSIIPTDGSVESIEHAAFQSCTSLVNIKIPKSVIHIAVSAFRGCTSLASITIPGSVTSIGNSAFADCINIKTITFKGTEEQWNAVQKGTNWDSNAGSSTSSGKYELAYGGSDPEPPVTTTTTATTTTTTTTTEMVTTTLPMFARFDFGTDTTAQDDGQTSHEWLKNNLSYNESYIKVEFFEDSWKIYALKTYVSGTTPTDAYAVVFQNIADVEYEDLVPGWGTWSRYPVNESYVGKTDSWNGKHQYMKIRIKNNTENNMISFGFKGNNNKFATTYCVSNMYMQGGDDKLTCTPSDEWAVYYYDVGKCCQVSSYAYGAGRNNNTDIGVATSFTQWVELYGPTGAYNGLNWTAVGGPCNGLKFNLLGAEKYQAKVPAWCDSRTNIKEGAAVEIDYIIFGSTIEQLEAYKSKIEKDPSLERPKPSDPEAKPSEGLKFTSNGDGTCYVSGIGSCTDTDIVIPAVSPDGDKVTGIGEAAFEDTSLTSITIPDGVTSIGNFAFDNCYKLSSITIPDSVTSIGAYAFSGCESITDITIPDSVTSIGDRAFNGTAYYNNEANWTDGVLYIGNHLIKAKLDELPADYTIKESTKCISNNAFEYCRNLVSILIPDSVTSIGEAAFVGCTSLTSITIPNSVMSIGDYAFSHCNSLVSVTVESGNTVYHSAGNCLIETASKTLIAGCKSSVIPTDGSVMSIGNGAFSGCTSLTSITVPDSVTSIGDYAFFNCTSLTRITIPDSVTSIGDVAFRNCTSLENVTIPDSVASIGSYAFNGCTSLTNITIPDSVTSIGYMAFYNCTSITSITIPSSVTSIGEYAFYYCTNLETITFNGTEEQWNAITKGSSWDRNAGSGTSSGKYTLVFAPEAKPSEGLSFVSNGDGTCYVSGIGSCTDTDIVIPAVSPDGDKVTGIGDGAFSWCSSLANLMIPDSVTSIGEFAFSGCTSLTSITISDSVTSIGRSAFDGTAYYNNEANWTDGVLCIGNYLIEAKSGELPANYTIKVDTKVIADNAFEYCINLVSIVIPESVMSISNYTFSNCKSLASVTIPDSVTSIGKKAFWSCTSLASITIPDSVTSIGDYAFSRCESLTSIKIPDGVTSIEWAAFSECTSLASITIPGSVTSIGNEAFFRCTSLTSVTFGENSELTGIGYQAFYNCTSLTSITMPNSVTGIGYQAFYNCTSLTSITMPNSVTNIGDSAFCSCTSLETITFKGTKAQWNAITKGSSWNYNAGKNTSSGKYTLVFAPEVKPSEGLEFTLNADVNSYSVTGIGTCADTEVVIPSAYNGLPVTGIGDRAFSCCGRLTNVTIPGTVTSIGDYAFFGCGSLASIVIPDSVTAIGNGAFRECVKLSSATLPKGIKRISKEAFHKCYWLTNITIPNSVEAIEAWAFRESGLKNLTIPESVSSIEDSAFYRCPLTNVTIPKNVTNIGIGAFLYCPQLESIIVDEGNSVYHSSGNCLIETASKTIIVGCKNSVIPVDGSVTIIGNTAFGGCEGLVSIIIPRSIAIMDDFAFANCTNLTSITIPDSVTAINTYALYGCRCLETITFNGNEKQWNAIKKGNYWDNIAGLNTSSGKYTLVFAPEVKPSEGLSFVSNGDGTCYVSGIGSCTDTDIVIPAVSPDGDKVTGIGDRAFSRCKSLTSITIPDSVTSIGDYAFSYCTSLTSIAIPESVTSIGRSALNGCSSLTSMTIPDSVTSIGRYVFDWCTSLESVIFGENSKLTSIGDWAFEGCTSLTSITIPDSVTSIGGAAFRNCTSLESITVESGNTVYHSAGNCLIETASGKLILGCKNSVIPDDGSVMRIGNYAFSSISKLTSIIIPDSITSIGDNAFSGCTSLKEIAIPVGVTSISKGTFSGCTSLTSITIPDSVTSIGDDAFFYCTSLESVTFGENSKLTSIGNSAFYYCASLERITFGKNSKLTSIGDSTFNGCTSLTSITIPDSVTSIGNYAFSYCTSLESITVESGNTVYHSAGNCLIETASGKLILGCKNSVIPDDGSVTRIGNYAFSNCTSLTSITLPDSVTSIGDSAFNGCKSLKEIAIPVGVTSISKGTFSGCTSLTSITLPDSVTSIGDSAFNGCTSLTSITLPDSVTSVGRYAFDGCKSLTSVHVTDLAKWCEISFGSYDANPLCYAHNLYINGQLVTNLIIPNSVTRIGDWAFSGCRDLTSITIPCSVTSIGESAFSYCRNLEAITFKGTEEQWNAIAKGDGWDSNAGSGTSSHNYNLIFE